MRIYGAEQEWEGGGVSKPDSEYSDYLGEIEKRG